MPVDGVTAPVRIVRDTWGVPHIFAANQDDLFFAQGFVQAQDRLFQMDLWRRSAQGRLSEVLGPNFIERDAMTRRIQYRGDLAAEWASYGPDAKAIAGAFVRGINAWALLARERPPEEFVLAGWKPEVWQAEDLLNRTDAFTSGGDALDEIFRARLVAAVGAARARQLLPGDRGLVVPPGLDPAVVPELAAEAIRRVGTPPFFLGLAAPVTDGTVRSAADASDTARTLDSPSRRYLVHLTAPGWNVIGATAPWQPGVAAGHNARIAFNAESKDDDTQDIFVEKLNPADPRQVADHGRWVEIETQKGFVAVRGRKTPVDFTIDTTRHGVIVASDLARHLAFALRWIGSEPGAADAMISIARGRATTLVQAHRVPVRRGWTGGMPAPGWSGDTEWTDERDGAAPEPRFASSPQGEAAKALLESVRRHPDRGDALLQALATRGSTADSLTAQRAAMVDALAEALRERTPMANGSMLFAHPLAVTAAARRRFNVSVRAPAGATDPLAFTFDPSDWDRSTAINAPGQSGSPESPHYADLAVLWSEGKTLPLSFSEPAVQAHAATTLTLVPKPR